MQRWCSSAPIRLSDPPKCKDLDVGGAAFANGSRSSKQTSASRLRYGIKTSAACVVLGELLGQQSAEYGVCGQQAETPDGWPHVDWRKKFAEWNTDVTQLV